MRIRSPFKDYYDSLQQWTYGQSKFFTRIWSDPVKNKYFTGLHSDYCYSKDSRRNEVRFNAKQTIVGFCGKLYSYIVVESFNYDEQYRKVRIENESFFTLEGYCDFLKGEPFRVNASREYQRELSKSFFTKEDNAIFIENNCPIFVVEKDEFTCCPLSCGTSRNKEQFSLASIGFSVLVPPEQAWSELTSYIDFLGTQYKEVPEMSDQTKIDSHGFTKSSFRKRSE